jgi:transposase-like protein
LRDSNNIPRRDFLGSLFWLGTPPKLCGYWSQHVVNSRIDWVEHLFYVPNSTHLTNMSAVLTAPAVAKPDELAIPYALPQVPYMSPDLVHLGVLDSWLEDDNMWVPVTKSVSFKPLLLCTAGGYYVNFSSVARDHDLSPSTVSKAIAALEKKLGVKLFHRGPHEHHLTDEGVAYQPSARAVIDAVAAAESMAEALPQRVAGVLRIYVMATFS